MDQIFSILNQLCKKSATVPRFDLNDILIYLHTHIHIHIIIYIQICGNEDSPGFSLKIWSWTPGPATAWTILLQKRPRKALSRRSFLPSSLSKAVDVGSASCNER